MARTKGVKPEDQNEEQNTQTTEPMEKETSAMETVAIKDTFKVLNAINVNDHVEKKDTGKVQLSYLSWVWAWKEVRSRFPDATYTVERDPATNMPYFYDPQSGIIVYTSVTIEGETHQMWLPVMDGANNAMKFEPYEIPTKYGAKQVGKASMMDINKAIMRCLAKNLAMFGLGLYIYAGEDLPETPEETKELVDALIAQAQLEIDKIKNKGALSTTEQKREFVEKHIVPHVGSANYKTCKDPEKLKNLVLDLGNLAAA